MKTGTAPVAYDCRRKPGIALMESAFNAIKYVATTLHASATPGRHANTGRTARRCDFAAPQTTGDSIPDTVTTHGSPMSSAAFIDKRARFYFLTQNQL